METRDTGATDPGPVPDILAALDAGTATPAEIFAWARHPYVCTSELERQCFAAVEAAHRQEIERLTQERDHWRQAWSEAQVKADTLNTKTADELYEQNVALTAQVATLREALAGHASQCPQCHATALAATEGGTK